MTALPPWALIALSCLTLIGFGFGGLLVSHAHTGRQSRARRVESVVAPFRQSPVARLQAFRAARPRERSLVDMAAALFDFRPANADQYPCKWWLVLGVAFVAARIGAGFVTDVVGPVGLLAMPLLWIGGCRAFFGWAVGRRQAALLEQFPDALAMIVRSVRVGIPVLGAINGVAREAATPTSVEFSRLASELAVGVPLDEAVVSMAARVDLSDTASLRPRSACRHRRAAA